MTERQIFLDALEQSDPTARAAYLDAACAGRPELRQRIDELLQSHQSLDAFLQVPAMEQLADAEQSLSFLQPATMPDSLGRLDHYEVLEVVGRGGMGTVLRARDVKLQRIVAVKVLGPRLAASATARQRFVREAQAAAAVRDDHVVAIHAVADDGPVPYLVMEYISGITLDERVRCGGPLEPKEILRIGIQLARGLAAAHAQGVIHRDIKPSNVLLENGVQRVKITDFGLAGVADDAGGTRAGTPLYMSPEQARGEPTDQRTDLFSLGAVLYTLCAGRPPFEAERTAEVLKRVCEETPRPVREVRRATPAGLSDLVGQLLSKDERVRPASAEAVADRLSEQLAHLQQPPRGDPPSGRSRLLLASFLVVLIALAGLGAVLKPWRRSTPESARQPRPRGESITLNRSDIAPQLLALAGSGDPERAPPELAAVLGDGHFLLPHVGGTAWMDQSPDGRILAVPLDEDVVLFDAQTGTYLRTLPGPGGRVVWVAFSPVEQALAATTWREGWGGALRVWDLEAGRERFTKPLPGPKVSGALVFSPDGARLIAESSEEQLEVMDARSGQQVQSVELSPGGVPSLCFSADGHRLAVALWHGKGAKVFDWDGDKLGPARVLEHREAVGAVKYSPDGKLLASGDTTGFRLWHAETLAQIRTVMTPAQQLAFTPDGRTLFASWTNGQPKSVHTFTRWDVATGKDLPSLTAEVPAERTLIHHQLSRDGKTLFVIDGGKATHVRAIDTATGKVVFPHEGHSAALQALAVCSDNRTLASAGDDRSVKLWDLGTGRVRLSLSAHADAVIGLAFSPDGSRLASASRDGAMILWDADSGKELLRLRGQSGSSRAQFSPDGQAVAAGGPNGVVMRWDAATGKPLEPLLGHAGEVRCVAFSADGHWLVSGGEDRSVCLHDLAGGTTRKLVAASAINEVAFSPDGRSLAAIGDAPETTVRLWNLESGEETAWRSPRGTLRGLAFSPTMPLLVSGAEDGTVRLWDRIGSERRARVIELGSAPSGVRALAFTPDGRYLATANGNGTVYLLRVEVP
jgi:WD40 repeat protein/serine/threonine protein kinase